jgi:hypothetical protein
VPIPNVVRVPLDNEGRLATTKDGPLREHEIVVTINLDRIVRLMGKTAVRSKTGKTVDGPVTVRHVRKGVT